MSLEDQIRQFVHANSGLEAHRRYLGMSGIADCPRAQWTRYMNGVETGDNNHRNAYRGYLLEKDIKQILISIGFMKPESERELLAEFDSRFRGHTEGEDVSGGLIEVKTMSKVKYDAVVSERRLAYRHYRQVQAYMKYGNYTKCTAVIRCTETFEFHVMVVQPNYAIMAELEQKAKMILACIDESREPPCTCNRCR